MKTRPQNQDRPQPGSGAGLDLLSPEVETRAIEVAFLQRLTRLSSDAGARVLAAEDNPDAEKMVSDTYARFHNPVFELSSRVMESAVPEDAGFGRFRGKK